MRGTVRADKFRRARFAFEPGTTAPSIPIGFHLARCEFDDTPLTPLRCTRMAPGFPFFKRGRLERSLKSGGLVKCSVDCLPVPAYCATYRARQSASPDPFAKAVDGESAIGCRLLAR